jgi:hypothetical protein
MRVAGTWRRPSKGIGFERNPALLAAVPADEATFLLALSETVLYPRGAGPITAGRTARCVRARTASGSPAWPAKWRRRWLGPFVLGPPRKVDSTQHRSDTADDVGVDPGVVCPVLAAAGCDADS